MKMTFQQWLKQASDKEILKAVEFGQGMSLTATVALMKSAAR